MILTTPAKLWFLVLLVVWGVLLIGGFLTGTLNEKETERIPRWKRMGSSAVLVLTAWSWFALTNNTDLSSLAFFLALGMTFGLIGDLFLADLIPIGSSFIYGIGSFGIGHIFYIIGLFTYGNQAGLDDPAKRWIALIAWLSVGAVLWFIMVYRGASERSIVHYIALPYALLLASTAAFATGMALQSSAFILIAAGAGLFLLSDLVLAANLFNGLHIKGISDIIWLTYGPGQMLIVYGIILTYIFS